MILQDCVEKSDVVPLTGLDKNLHILIFGIITPLIGSIITALIFARFLAPLFIKAKNNLLARDYEDAYISREAKPYKIKVILRRIIYLLLLTLGFLAFLFPIVDPQLWVDEQTYCVYRRDWD